jgi:hypothetical protein
MAYFLPLLKPPRLELELGDGDEKLLLGDGDGGEKVREGSLDGVDDDDGDGGVKVLAGSLAGVEAVGGAKVFAGPGAAVTGEVWVTGEAIPLPPKPPRSDGVTDGGGAGLAAACDEVRGVRW